MKKTTLILILIIFTLINLLGSFFIHYILKNQNNKLEKEINFIDNGISSSVEKVYDSVVVIEAYDEDGLSSTATGFVYKIIDNKAYIITNQHVIEDTSDIYVTFTNNSKEKVEVIGSDEYEDIAVLSLNKKDYMKEINISSSQKSKIGDTTFVIGTPIDSKIYSWTVTRGILSGKNRLVEYSVSDDNYMIDVLQTDAPINSGNSGGPLCNANGEVIGVVNLKLTKNSVESIGFAIPIENVVNYADKIINGEKIIRPYLGIKMFDINVTELDKTGVGIKSFEKDSTLDKKGLQIGDIIIKLDGMDVVKSTYFKYMLYKYNVGDSVKLTYLRNGKENECVIVLESKIK